MGSEPTSERDRRTRTGGGPASIDGRLLGELAVELARSRTVGDIATAVVRSLEQAGFAAATVRLRRGGSLPIAAAGDVLADLARAEPPLPITDPGPIGESFRTGQPVTVAASTRPDDDDDDRTPTCELAGAEWAIVAPVFDRELAAIGVITTVGLPDGVDGTSFDEVQHRLVLDAIRSVCEQAAAAVERTAARDRLTEHRARTEAISRLLAEIEPLTTETAQLTRAVELLVPLLGEIVLIEAPAGHDQLRAVACSDDRTSVGAAARRHSVRRTAAGDGLTLAAGETLLLDDPVNGPVDPDSATGRLLESLAARSVIAVSLPTASEVGCTLVAMVTDETRRLHDDDDVADAVAIADRISRALRQTAERTRSRRSSRQLQRALLPPRIASHDDLEVSAVYQTDDDQLDIGGDWYDTYRWPDGRYAIIVGDVAGHGSDAAVAMGRIRSAAAATIPDGPPEPQAILAAIERFALQTDAATFVTAGCVVIDPGDDSLSYALSGHPPPLLVRDGTATWLDRSLGGPICPLITERPSATRVGLRPDDLLVLYTDGLVDRRTNDLGESLDDLAAVAATIGDVSVDLANRRIVGAFADGGDDDIVVVTARYKSSTPGARWSLPPTFVALETMRHEMRDHLERHGLADDVVDDIVLATNEAVANAITHAGLGLTDAGIDVRIAHTPEVVDVTVHDDGMWAEPRTYRLGDGGRGTEMMRRLATRFERTSGASGTTVMMRFGRDEP